MFPNEKGKVISDTLSSFYGDVNRAVGKLAGCTDEGTIIVCNIFLNDAHWYNGSYR